MRVGIDVGGTFTDAVLVDDGTGRTALSKALTTPGDLAAGVLEAMEKVLAQAGGAPDALDVVVHGTTIGTNALIERKGCRVGLLTTEGFRDVLEIGRIQRPKEGLYDFTVDNPLPLVPRHLRLEARERVDRDGNVVVRLDEETVDRAAGVFAREKVESVAVSFLFSFVNPAHERAAGERLRKRLPKVGISLSSEVSPEFREFERTSTTVINAYLQPIMDRYLGGLQQRIRKRYGEVDLRIMQAGGGTMTAESARSMAVHTVNSGPAGGALAGGFVGGATGFDKIVSVDMGGTSFDICLSEERAPRVTTEGGFEGFPVKVPVIDVNAIGAGGGSIAWLDSGGLLNVGPQSAGAVPGPACYGRGGDKPTVTDANLVLGRLNPEYFLGGEMRLDEREARKAVQSVADEMGTSVEKAALGVIRVVNANMGKGIGVHCTEKGYDLREFALVAFGGAGPLHAVQLAQDLGMPRAIVPIHAGDLSALGLLVADTKYDHVLTWYRGLDELGPEELGAALAGLEAAGQKHLETDKLRGNVKCAWSADLRYRGQSYELTVPVDRAPGLTGANVKRVAARFHALHRQVYGYGSTDDPIDVVNLRVSVIVPAPKLRLRELKPEPGNPKKGERKVVFDEGAGKVPVYERARLRAGGAIRGPALVEEPLSTTVLNRGSTARVDRTGNLVVSFGRGR